MKEQAVLVTTIHKHSSLSCLARRAEDHAPANHQPAYFLGDKADKRVAADGLRHQQHRAEAGQE